MIRVSIEVHNSAIRFPEAVRAKGIRRKVRLIGRLYPGSDARVTFPTDPERFFDEETDARVVVLEQLDRVAERRWRERAELVRDVQADLDRLRVPELAEKTETGEEARR